MFKSTWLLGVLAIVLFGVLASLQHHKSYTVDEVYELRNLSTSWAEIAGSPDGFPPLYRWLLSQWTALTAESQARLFSAVTAVIGLFFVALTGRLFGSSTASFSAVFYTVSACHLEYAQQARAYSLYICLGAVVVWAATHALLRRGAIYWVCFVLASQGLLWTHYHCVSFLVVIWLGFFFLGWHFIGWRQKSKQSKLSFMLRCLVSVLASVVMLLPWFAPLQVDLNNPPPAEAVNPADLTGIAYTYLTLIHGWCVGPSQMELYEWEKLRAILAVAPWAVLSIGCFAIIVAYALTERRMGVASELRMLEIEQRERVWVARWMLALIVLVPLSTALLTWIQGGSYVPRYMAVLVVPVSLIFGLGAKLSGLSVRALASFILVLLNVISFAGRNFADRYDRENYRQVLAEIAATSEVANVLVLSHYLGHAVEYQAGGGVRVFKVGLNSDEPDDWLQVQQEMAQAGIQGQSLWIVADWMRADDLRLLRKNSILAALAAQPLMRISATTELWKGRAEFPEIPEQKSVDAEPRN